jgi:hypothetical protein
VNDPQEIFKRIMEGEDIKSIINEAKLDLSFEALSLTSFMLATAAMNVLINRGLVTKETLESMNVSLLEWLTQETTLFEGDDAE